VGRKRTKAYSVIPDLSDANVSIERISKNNIFVNQQSKIVPELISAINSSIIKVNGDPRQAVMSMVPTAMSEEVYGWIENVYGKMFQLSGINQMTAQGQKPEGVDSAVAMRELQDIQSGRFELVSKDYDQMYVEIAKLIIAFSKQLADDGVKLDAKVKTKRGMEKIDWKEASLEDDEFTMQVFPTAALPNYPAGRIQMVTELIKIGMLDQETGLGLLQFPDLEDVINLRVAGRNVAKMIVDDIRYEGTYTEPTNLLDIQYCTTYCHNSILEAMQVPDTPEENVEKMQRFLSQCLALQKANAPQPEPQAPPPGPVLAKPEAVPTSPLLPQQPPK